MGTRHDRLETYRTSASNFKSYCIIPPTYQIKHMKVSVFPSILTLIVSLTICYLAYYLADSHSDPNTTLVCIVTFLSSLLTLGCVMGLRVKNDRMNVNVKIWGVVAFLVTTITNLCFAFWGVSMPFYVILIVLLLSIHFGIAWKLFSIRNV